MFVQQLAQWVLALAKFAPYQEGQGKPYLKHANVQKHDDQKSAVSEAIASSNSCVSARAVFRFMLTSC
jgi:hypothetical protein